MKKSLKQKFLILKHNNRINFDTHGETNINLQLLLLLTRGARKNNLLTRFVSFHHFLYLHLMATVTFFLYPKTNYHKNLHLSLDGAQTNFNNENYDHMISSTSEIYTDIFETT